MIARLSIEDRTFTFRKYTDMLGELLTAFIELLNYTLSPTDARNYDGKWDYRDIENCSRKYDDIDAPFIRNVCKVLESLHDEMKKRRDEVIQLEICNWKEWEALMAEVDSESTHEQKGETSWVLK